MKRNFGFYKGSGEPWTLDDYDEIMRYVGESEWIIFGDDDEHSLKRKYIFDDGSEGDARFHLWLLQVEQNNFKNCTFYDCETFDFDKELEDQNEEGISGADFTIKSKDVNAVDEIIDGRESDYGDAFSSHSNIAMCWTAFCCQRGFDVSFKASDVAMMMHLFKDMRESFKHKEDNVTDSEAYYRFYKEFVEREGVT